MSGPTIDRAFPKLTEDELACVAEIGTARTLPRRRRADRGRSPGLSVLRRAIGRDRDRRGLDGRGPRGHRPRAGRVHRRRGHADRAPGADLGHRARSTARSTRSPASRIRQLLNEIPDLSDKLLEAFQTRRELLEASGFLGIRVIGAGDSKETLALREFCYKNKVPHTFQDIEEESGKKALAALGCGPEDTPVIACSKQVARRPSLEHVRRVPGHLPRDPGRPLRRHDHRRGPGGPRGRRLRRLRGPEDAARSTAWARGARPDRARGSRTTWASPPGYPARSWRTAATCRRSSSASSSGRPSPCWTDRAPGVRRARARAVQRPDGALAHRADRHRRLLPSPAGRGLRSASRAPACTTPRPRSRRASAAERRPSSSAAATRRARPRCTCRSRPRR